MKIKVILLRVWFIVLSILLLYPLLITFTNSFMESTEVIRHYQLEGSNMLLIPEQVTLKSYLYILFYQPKYLILFWNSIKIAVCVIIGQVIVAFLGAYGFVRSKFKEKEIIFCIYIVVMLLPLQVVLVPNFMIIQRLGLIDSHLAIILPGIFSPFGVFLLTQYMKSIPEEYVEAAYMDGCNEIDILIHIYLPIAKAGVFALVILTFVEYWNVVEQAIVFLQDIYKQPLSLFLSKISEEQIGSIFAASCFYMIPVIIVFLYGQDYLVEGIELSGIKGR
ncbi:carbohydrate ABC transporter permease [Cellulosilyticum ruminicola]|uniref:carbohydrate ABC transporter permease n=1 Tax=Cellulosilyticum ruminicola TaxID=425254 RepID=UPI0006CFB570|nr:carbohydrate ABC transporter permease [Cellulosilyticum ruminicola]